MKYSAWQHCRLLSLYGLHLKVILRSSRLTFVFFSILLLMLTADNLFSLPCRHLSIPVFAFSIRHNILWNPRMKYHSRTWDCLFFLRSNTKKAYFWYNRSSHTLPKYDNKMFYIVFLKYFCYKWASYASQVGFNCTHDLWFNIPTEGLELEQKLNEE